jgi:hypothetical protein
MGVSAVRVMAGAGVLVGGLMLATSAADLASADSGNWGHRHTDEPSGKGVNNEGGGRISAIIRSAGEGLKRHNDDESSSPSTIFGDGRGGTVAGSESSVVDTGAEPGPALSPGPERDANPDGDNVDIAGADPDGAQPVDPVDEPAPVKTLPNAAEYPLFYYLLEVRRGGGDWWNATTVVSRFAEVINPPPPKPTPSPAIRGAEPEPVLDASGGGGGGYQPADFDSASVLKAPVIAVPVLPPAAVRFPSAATGGALGTSTGTGADVEQGAPASGVRSEGAQGTGPVGTVKSMTGQAPPSGYTDYLRRPGLPQLAGAALPGMAGIVLMTLGGGVVGYRQAKAGRMVRMSSAARYLP